MAVDRALDLGRIDVLAAGDDHVLGPVEHIDVAVFIEVTDIAGGDPAVGINRAGSGFGQLPIAEHVA